MNLVVAFLGNKERFMFKGTPANIASFIWNYKDYKVTITDVNSFMLTAIGGFLHKISDPGLREDILKELIPLQKGEKYPVEIEYYGTIL